MSYDHDLLQLRAYLKRRGIARLAPWMLTVEPGGPGHEALKRATAIRVLPTLQVIAPDGRLLATTDGSNLQANPDGTIAGWRALARPARTTK